jgi:nicotinamidase/pyrazinamidase
MGSDTILWCVDAQRDFMLPGGKLYVPGAEKLLPNIRQLVDLAGDGQAFLVSHGCFHAADDPEFKIFPPHCVKGTSGAAFVPESMTDNYVRVSYEPGSVLPEDLLPYRQIVLEKQTLDIFEGRHAGRLVERLPRDSEFFVFGVVTEYCVQFAVRGLLERGRNVFLVEDAIETLSRDAGAQTISQLKASGANVVRTSDVLARCTSVAR